MTVEQSRRLVLVAGSPSHPPGLHEFRAGALLLAKCLDGVPGLTVDVHDHGQLPVLDPADADAVVIYSDGGPTHPLHEDDRWSKVDALVRGGLGIGFMHYAVEVPAGHGDAELLRWIGGVYAEGVSCNPIWEARFDELPDHAITRGVEPFTAADEWYFNIRFDEGGSGDRIHRTLVATPSDGVRTNRYVWPKGPYDHIIAASGRPETLMWAVDRADGGRGFGFNGGHVHTNWGNASFRRLVLNALVWVTGADVPDGGVDSTVSAADLDANHDEKPQPST